MSAAAATAEARETKIPARMDRLPWTRWHWLVVLALGTVWILDGLEVTIVGALGGVLKSKDTLAFSSTQIGLLGSIYVAGAVCGALVFGYLTDRLGRKRLFFVTLGLYLVATGLTAVSWSFASFAVFRFFTGAGIGGEYAAINSAIDELIPARVRGWVDLAINGSYWLGTAVGAAATLVLLNPDLLPVDVGWRLAFGVGAGLGLVILVTRRFLPESPRWLMIHGRFDEAEQIVDEIEQDVSKQADTKLEDPEESITIEPRERTGFLEIGKTLFARYPKRSLVGFSLMMAQAFFYNAVFFTYAIILTDFFDVNPTRVGVYLIPFAAGNFLGPLCLGWLFDRIGRREMIGATYLIAAAGLVVTAVLFSQDVLAATSLTLVYSVIFFFASAGASAAYLTVSEIFPLEIRAMAIAFFYAIATGAGGIAGPVIFGALIGTKDPTVLMWGFVGAAALMAIAGVVELVLGVPAEQESLEDVAEPLAAEDADGGDGGREGTAARRPGRASRRAPRRSYGWSCYPTYSTLPSSDADLPREADVLAETLGRSGRLSRDQLLRASGARTWGPGRFGRALRAAQRRGLIRRSGLLAYEATPARTPRAGGPAPRAQEAGR